MPLKKPRAAGVVAAAVMLIACGSLRLGAQMVPVVAEPVSVPESSPPAPLYTVSGNPPVSPAPDPAATSSDTSPAESPDPAAANGAGRPAASAGGVTLPPSRRVRDLPRPGTGDRYHMRPLRAVAFGLTASTLGGGAEIAVPLARTLNVRVGASYLSYRTPFSIDGIDFNPGIKFVAGRSTLDWFPHHGGFHISAGALFFQNTIAGTASVVEGQSFTLAGTTYINSVDDPVHGSASLNYSKKLAPLVLLGFGNILPRSGRHVSVPIEFGGAYLQPPDVRLALAGTACTTQGCFNAATDPTIQADLASERSRFTSDLHFLEVYPVISIGVACRF